jgi:glycosyltransferase involved in cell wall biosynthesis
VRFSDRFDPARRARGISVRGLNSTKYGLDLAIRAWVGLRAAELTILGVGPLEARFRRLVERCGSRAVLEARAIPHDRMPDLYSGYGFFVAPSRVEAQGVAMCEAMACGLPVIATRVGGIPEFVDDGVEGFLVPPEDPAAIRRAVETLMADPERHLAMSRAARARIERQCSPEVVTRRELAVLAGDPDDASSPGTA